MKDATLATAGKNAQTQNYSQNRLGFWHQKSSKLNAFEYTREIIYEKGYNLLES